MLLTVLSLLAVDPDAFLKRVFNGPGPSAEIGDTHTPRPARTTIEELPDGTIRVCYWHKETSFPYACIA